MIPPGEGTAPRQGHSRFMALKRFQQRVVASQAPLPMGWRRPIDAFCPDRSTARSPRRSAARSARTSKHAEWCAQGLALRAPAEAHRPPPATRYSPSPCVAAHGIRLRQRGGRATGDRRGGPGEPRLGYRSAAFRSSGRGLAGNARRRIAITHVAMTTTGAVWAVAGRGQTNPCGTPAIRAGRRRAASAVVGGRSGDHPVRGGAARRPPVAAAEAGRSSLALRACGRGGGGAGAGRSGSEPGRGRCRSPCSGVAHRCAAGRLRRG